jgi:exodeoxyribonuclease VII large subunit
MDARKLSLYDRDVESMSDERRRMSSGAMAPVLTVSALTRSIRQILEEAVGELWVEGEISNLKTYHSGHTYFTLKDAGAQLKCMVWAEHARSLNGKLADGKQIQAFGRISVFEKAGQYQLYVEEVKQAGRGALQDAFEKLKARLKAEGLFDPERKRPLPVFPRRVGVVTSPTGAAIRDFLRTLERRFPNLNVLIFPSRVQGEGAAAEIASGIRALNAVENVDVIVVMRGGGSLEDLWAFNEEVVARALAASGKPTISAVGHEVDFTISDFAADFRAATPTAAADAVIRSREEWLGELEVLGRQLFQRARLLLSGWKDRLMVLREALAAREPRQALREWRERLERVRQQMRELDPRLLLGPWNEKLVRAEETLSRIASRFIAETRHRLAACQTRLAILNPKATLRRGYSMTFDRATGRLIRSAAAVPPGTVLLTELHDGKIESQVRKP